MNTYDFQTMEGDVIDENGNIVSGMNIPYAAQMSSTLPWSKRKLEAKAEIAAEVQKNCSLLARQAMQNIATLSREEAFLSEVVPNGAARFKAICDTATMASIETIVSATTKW